MTPIDLASIPERTKRFSICTLVTAPEQYKEMIESFLAHGFDGDDCEFIYANNAHENRYDGYSGVNRFLSLHRATYVILCHQDVRLVDDGRAKLEVIISEMDARDPDWAVLGNAGGEAPGRLAFSISDPHGEQQRVGDLPSRVTALDENFLLVRTDANLSVSRDLSGFHLYAADICIHAFLLGRNCYVVDFHLRHLSPGKSDASFDQSVLAMTAKYQRALTPRWVTTPSTLMYLTSNLWVGAIANSRLGKAFARRFGKR